MVGAIPLLPQYTFMALCSVKKHRDINKANYSLNGCVTSLLTDNADKSSYAVGESLATHPVFI